MLGKPSGSVASLVNSTAVSCEFTPDLPGSYRIQLVTNTGGAGNVQVLIAAVTFDTNGVLIRNGWRVPAFAEKVQEDNFAGQQLGWFPDIEKVISDIGTFLGFDSVASVLTILKPETVNQGTTLGQVNTKEAVLNTLDSSLHDLVTLAIPNNSFVLHEVEVLAIQNGAAIGGYFKRSKAYLRTGGSVAAGTTRNIDKQFVGGSPTWDVTLDDDGAGNARVRANGQGANVTWYVVRQALRILPTP